MIAKETGGTAHGPPTTPQVNPGPWADYDAFRSGDPSHPVRSSGHRMPTHAKTKDPDAWKHHIVRFEDLPLVTQRKPTREAITRPPATVAAPPSNGLFATHGTTDSSWWLMLLGVFVAVILFFVLCQISPLFSRVSCFILKWVFYAIRRLVRGVVFAVVFITSLIVRGSYQLTRWILARSAFSAPKRRTFRPARWRTR